MKLTRREALAAFGTLMIPLVTRAEDNMSDSKLLKALDRPIDYRIKAANVGNFCIELEDRTVLKIPFEKIVEALLDVSV